MGETSNGTGVGKRAPERWVLLLLVVLMTLPALPRRELMPTDEPRFALVARQMVEDPAPLVPHLGYDPLTREGDLYADKPPLFFWLISLFSYATGGVEETSARLPSFLAALAAVLLTRRLGSLLAGDRAGFAAALILATSNQFFLRAGWCSIDMLLTALVLAATDCWLRAARALEPPVSEGGSPLVPAVSPGDRRNGIGLAALGGFAAAAATLSKGPVGLLFPLTFLVCNRFAHRYLPGALTLHRPALLPPQPAPEGGLHPPPHGAPGTDRGLHAATDPDSRRSESPAPVPGLPILVAAAAYLVPIGVWIAAITLSAGRAYTLEILFHQNVTRYLAAWNNIAPWHYYLYRLPLGLLPWTLLLPGAILAARGLPDERARPLRGLLLAAALLLVFFSSTTGKRGVYLLPLYPALALLLAVSWQRSDSRLHRVIAQVHVGTLLALGLLAPILLPPIAARKYPDLITDVRVLAAIMAIAVLVAAILHIRGRRDASLFTYAFGVAAVVAVGSFLLVPDANRRSGLRDFGSRLAALARPGDYLVVDQEGYEQILFYSHLNGARRNFDDTMVTIDAGAVTIFPIQGRRGGEIAGEDRGAPRVRTARPSEIVTIAGEAERATREVRYPRDARVLVVGKENRIAGVRASLGPTARVLLAARLSGELYLVLASRE